jgi:FtsZ-interacting cell division protein ZipA
MDTTAVLIIVGVLVLAAIVAAAGGFDRNRRARRTVLRERPVERVVEQPVVEERTTRRVAE